MKNKNSSHLYCKFPAGFTMLEIMIVVVIIAILVAAAAPNFKNFYAQTVQQDSSRTVATTLRTAQSLAIIHRVQMKVQFDMVKNKYKIIPDESLTKEYKTVPKYARIHQLPEGVKFTKVKFETAEKEDETSALRTLNFYANGSSDGGEIEIKGTKMAESTKIRIKKTTGNVIVGEDTTSSVSNDTSGNTVPGNE